MESQRITVWVTEPIRTALEAHIRKCRAAEKAWVENAVAGGADRRDARMQAAALRPERWPVQDLLVTRAVRARLEEEDLARDWEPLADDEERRLRLSGRWPGPQSSKLVAERQFGLPGDVVQRLRTAAWRVSEPWLNQLEEEGLVGVKLNAVQRARRDELAAQLMPPPRIVRQALARPFALHWAIPRG